MTPTLDNKLPVDDSPLHLDEVEVSPLWAPRPIETNTTFAK